MRVGTNKDDKSSSAIEGRRINNIISFNIKEVKTLNHHINSIIQHQDTFESDSYKQILLMNQSKKKKSKQRSKQKNKIQEIQLNHHKILSSIREKQKNKKKLKSRENNSKNNSKLKHKTKSLIKFSTIDQQFDKKKRKSQSPKRNIKSSYSSTKIFQKKQKLDKNNYIQKKQNKIIHQDKSEKNLKQRQSTKILQKTTISTKKKNTTKIHKNASKIQFLTTKRQQKPVQKIKQKKVIFSINKEKIKYKGNDYLKSDEESMQSGILEHKYKKKHQKSSKNNHHERFSHNTLRKKNSSRKLKTQSVLLVNQQVNKRVYAAVKIQKVFRGFLTRKYLEDYKRIIIAAVTIQRMWKGYQSRKRYKFLKQQQNKINSYQPLRSPVMLNNDLLHESSDRIHQVLHMSVSKLSKEDIEQWTNILAQILQEDKVDKKIKQKIIRFLDKGKQNGQSGRSSLSNRIIQSELLSEKKYIEDSDKRKKHSKPFLNCLISPHDNYDSPATCLSMLQKTPTLQQAEHTLENLRDFQRNHRQNITERAHFRKQELKEMLNHKLHTPKTHEKKIIQVQQKQYEELRKFDLNMQQVLQSYQRNNEVSKIRKQKFVDEWSLKSQSKESFLQKQSSIVISEIMLRSPEKPSPLKIKQYQSFDNSYTFIEEYLLCLIHFLRSCESSQLRIRQILHQLHKPKNLPVELILRNLQPIAEGNNKQQEQQFLNENERLDNSGQTDSVFNLPMYKYLQVDEPPIINEKYIELYNQSYKTLLRHKKGNEINLQEIYLKMLNDCLDEALKNTRLTNYIFINQKFSRHKKIKQQDKEDSKEEYQYEVNCAEAMNQIFQWDKYKMGYFANLQIQVNNFQSELTIAEIKQNKIKQMQNEQAARSWLYYDQLIEIIAQISQKIDQIILTQQSTLLAQMMIQKYFQSNT